MTFACRYVAPEIMMRQGGNEKSDIFSFGIVLSTIVCQKEPSGFEAVADRLAGCDSDLAKLVTDCTNIDGAAPVWGWKRPTALAVKDRLASIAPL